MGEQKRRSQKINQDIKEFIKESFEIKKVLLTKVPIISAITNSMIACYSRGGKILVAGNGGSAADAQHLVAELVGKYKLERASLPAIALTTDTSILTSVGNDFGFENIFKRQLESLGNEGDIFIGISTSGDSNNLVEAMKEAKKKGMVTIGFLGRNGGTMKYLSDYSLIIPSNNTPRIQEAHISLIHIICELLENKLFGQN
ncbi:D-sedoheptulose 7-phosphate isomerase [archaeon]|jgi:D-sedoheptulose 7-phosphate isomerase|nr:D-sedoheptulose 7-phosphate isomerase [archaeon]